MIAPTTEVELADAIVSAQHPLKISGGGTRPIGGALMGVPLTAAGLSGVTLYEPGALTLVARAGTPLAEIETALAAEGQRLAFEPMDHRPLLQTSGTPTIGGIIAANVSGPRRIQVGAARDFLLGVRFVDGTGRVLKNGGRVMKNVTGYDLTKMMAGSFGALGVLSEVSLKVLPEVETSTTLIVNELNPTEAVAALSTALGSPFEISGAAYLPNTQQALLRLEGFAASVAYRSERLTSVLARFGEVTIQPKFEWTNIRNVSAFANHISVWRVSVKPSDAPSIVKTMQQSHTFDYVLDWGGGLIWFATKEGQQVSEFHTKLQKEVASLGGHATLYRAPEGEAMGLPTFQPEPEILRRISRELRAKFDPRGLLNSGLMG